MTPQAKRLKNKIISIGFKRKNVRVQTKKNKFGEYLQVIGFVDEPRTFNKEVARKWAIDFQNNELLAHIINLPDGSYIIGVIREGH